MIAVSVLAVFLAAYLFVVLEHSTKINKAAPALLAAAVSWAILSFASGGEVHSELEHHIGEIAGVIFFIMGAMAMVELIEVRGGFVPLKALLAGRTYTQLVWILTGVTFFLSAVLDNLTTAIVMTSALVRLVPSRRPQLILAGLIIIAANAGGAWSPIGDVTTTMLWVAERISSESIIVHLILPSIAGAAVPAGIAQQMLRSEPPLKEAEADPREGNVTILVFGVVMLLLVPVIKVAFHVPPYIAVLASLGILWIAAEISQQSERYTDKQTMVSALRRIDMPGALFFLGMLLCVAALDSAGVLGTASKQLQSAVSDERIIAVITGILSAVVDNVPLVAAANSMYDASVFPQDHRFWHWLAYCAGTGGSMLIIGSAAGVAAMGIAHIRFLEYARVVGPAAFIGYCAGGAVLFVQEIVLRQI